MNKKESEKRAQFATRLGVIATAVGSAVGLGNVWRFPYEAGSGGGSAFVLIYVLCIVMLGIPVICAEFALGREGRTSIFGTFKRLQRKGRWHWVGIIGIIASLMILSFYSVVAGWTIEYFISSVDGSLASESDFATRFAGFSTGWHSVIWTVEFLLVNYLIARRGVQAGLEKMANIMMPLLFVILIVLCINSLTLSGASEGLRFMFVPDFGKITWGVVLSALGQAFFSLSIGLGCMLTYASYFSKDVKIVRSASITASLDTLVAVLSGIVIFPAVFIFGMQPEAGPTLVFEVLPNIFSNMRGGVIWSALFFFMLFLASLSSTMSMSEIAIAYFSDQLKMSRKKASRLTTAIAVVFGILCAMSFGIIKIPFFDFFNNFSSNILLPVGGLFISIFVGWVLDRRILRRQLTNGGKLKVYTYPLIVFCIRYVAPVALTIILVMSAWSWLQ